MQTSKFIVNLNDNTDTTSMIHLIKVKEPIYKYTIEDLKVKYIKPINTKIYGILEVGQKYEFDPSNQPYEYDDTLYYVYDTIRNAVDNEHNPEIFYLTSTDTIFKEKDNKLFCTSFTVNERVDITAENIYNKFKCPVDVMFTLSTIFKNLWNEIKNYVELYDNPDISPDILLNYCKYNYTIDNIDRLYSLSDNNLPSYLEPLKLMPITVPDTITRRANFVKRILKQYPLNPYNCYDFGEFLLEFLDKHTIEPAFARDWLVGDEDRVLQWGKRLKDYDIRDHVINKHFINPFTWSNEIGNKQEMLDRLLDSTTILTHETFNQMHCWLKYNGPNTDLLEKILTHNPMPEDILKIATDIGEIDKSRILVKQPINPIRYMQYYGLDTTSIIRQPSGEYFDYHAIINFAANVDQIKLSSNVKNQTLYTSYKEIINQVNNVNQDITKLFKKEYFSSEQIYYTWDREFEDKEFIFNKLLSTTGGLDTTSNILIPQNPQTGNTFGYDSTTIVLNDFGNYLLLLDEHMIERAIDASTVGCSYIPPIYYDEKTKLYLSVDQGFQWELITKYPNSYTENSFLNGDKTQVRYNIINATTIKPECFDPSSQTNNDTTTIVDGLVYKNGNLTGFEGGYNLVTLLDGTVLGFKDGKYYKIKSNNEIGDEYLFPEFDPATYIPPTMTLPTTLTTNTSSTGKVVSYTDSLGNNLTFSLGGYSNHYGEQVKLDVAGLTFFGSIKAYRQGVEDDIWYSIAGYSQFGTGGLGSSPYETNQQYKQLIDTSISTLQNQVGIDYKEVITGYATVLRYQMNLSIAIPNMTTGEIKFFPPSNPYETTKSVW